MTHQNDSQKQLDLKLMDIAKRKGQIKRRLTLMDKRMDKIRVAIKELREIKLEV